MALPASTRDRALPPRSAATGAVAGAARPSSPSAAPRLNPGGDRLMDRGGNRAPREASHRSSEVDPRTWDGPACLWAGRGSGRSHRAAAHHTPVPDDLTVQSPRWSVSRLWHRLRFSSFSPLADQRRSRWMPRKPRRGKPEGTKGAGSRSL